MVYLLLFLATIALILQVYKTYQIWYWSRLTTITVSNDVTFEEGDTFMVEDGSVLQDAKTLSIGGELLTVLRVNGNTITGIYCD